MISSELKKALEYVRQHSCPVESEVEEMCRSEVIRTKLHGILCVRQIVEAGDLSNRWLTIATSHLFDNNADCRWQAFIIVGSYIQTEPDYVWSIVRLLGHCPDKDVQAATATVLMEHLLDSFPDTFLAEAKVMTNQSPVFARTMSMCWRGKA